MAKKLLLSRKKAKKTKQTKLARKTKGGKCSCNSSFFTGGSPNLAPYPLNTYENDPRDSIQSTRIMPNMVGGKSKRISRTSRKYRQSRKKMNGGATSNVITNGYSVPGAALGGNILAGNSFDGSNTSLSTNHGSNIVV